VSQKLQNAPAPLARIQQNILARSERKLLNWLCARMPAWVTPDLLTTLGVVGAIATFFGYCASILDDEWLWLAIAGYVVQWFGDSMDGSLARFRGIERPSFGYFIDHSCDGLVTLLILLGIGLSPFVRLDVALVVLAGYLLMSIHAYLAARVIGEFKLSYLAAGPTELRLLLIVLTGAMMAFGPTPGAFAASTDFDIIFGVGGAVLILLFIFQTMVVARRLSAHE